MNIIGQTTKGRSNMNKQHRDEINEIVDKVVATVPVSEIYLFGSFAQGKENQNSDLDFYVVIPDDCGVDEFNANWAINKAVTNRKRAIDILVGTKSKFERRKEYFYSIEQEIKDTGVRIYGKD